MRRIQLIVLLALVLALPLLLTACGKGGGGY
jgi:predicted small secreted protein